MERNGRVEFGFDFSFDLFRFSYSFVVSWRQGLPCRWFYKGSYRKQWVASRTGWCVVDTRFPGLFVQIFASSILSGLAGLAKHFGLGAGALRVYVGWSCVF